MTLEPIVLGMTDDMAPAFESDELTYYEVKLPVRLPVARPSQEQRQLLNQERPAPYGRTPWVTTEDLDVQITWTLTNLDSAEHEVNLLVDPWNEFGRYYPGLAIVDEEEQIPNLSGIQDFFPLPGTDEGVESRRHGTLTFDDVREMAIDFSTVMNIIQNPPPMDSGGPDVVSLVNHAFSFRNLSTNDPLVQRYIPEVRAGITGFDIGLRTLAPANLSLEIVVEIFDRGEARIPRRVDFECRAGECQWVGVQGGALLNEPSNVITVGG